MTEHEPLDDLELPEGEADAPAAPARRRGRRPGLVLQPRDLAVLAALGEARYLTAQAVEWLFYPWRERYKAYYERSKTDKTAVYRPAGNVYGRLGALADLRPPLLARIVRLSDQARSGPTRLDGAYALTEAGAELVAEHLGVELDTLAYQSERRRRSVKNLEHSVQIGLFYAALRCALEHSGQALAGWRGDHHLAARDPEGRGAAYDRVRIPGVQEPIAVLPDATFTLLDGERCFVELDRGLTNLKAWGEKLRAFEAYRGSHQLRDRYGVDTFTVLVVCPTETRQRRIAEEAIKVIRHAPERYLFLLADRVHPTSIRPTWRRVAGFTWGRRRVVDRLIDAPDELRWSTAPLWKLPSNPPE